MKTVAHKSAKPSHYNKESLNYDAFNEKKSAATNLLVEKILKEHKVKSVLDLTCGTGSQVFWLTKQGYTVVGSDINEKMLKIAKKKAQKDRLDLTFLKGDMCTARVGKFDAVITIFNAVGHLTKTDFEKVMRNIHENLNPGGLYIFDIFNLSYLLHENNITRLTIDWQELSGDTTIRDIQYSTINEEGVFASFTTSYAKKGGNPPKISRSTQTLQVYTANELQEMLTKNGFKVLTQCSVDGARFSTTATERIVTVAKKDE